MTTGSDGLFPCRSIRYGTSMKRKPYLSGFLVLGFLFFLAPSVLAQAPQGTGQPAQVEAEPEGPKAIPAPRIVQRAQEVQGVITEIRSTLQDSTRLKAIQEQLPRTSEAISVLGKSTLDPLDKMPVRRIRTLGAEWGQYEDQLRGWAGYLEKEMQGLYDSEGEIQELRAVWELTRDAARAEKLPKAVLDRAGEVLKDLGTIDKELRERIALFLGLQDTIAKLQIQVSETLTAIRASQDRAGRWFTRDSLPLWKELAIKEDPSAPKQRFAENRAEIKASLSGFWNNYRDRIFLNFAILAIVFGVVVILGWRLRRWKADEELEGARYFLSRPLGSALLITMFATIPLYPNASVAASELIALILILPFARLLPGLMDPRLRKILVPVGLIFVLNRLEGVALEYSIQHRLILLFIDVLAIAAAAWVVRSGVLKSGNRSMWFRAARLLPLGILILVMAVLANVWGSMSLASLLSTAVLNTMYMGFALWLAVKILDAVLLVALRTQLFRTFGSVRRHSGLIHGQVMVYAELAAGLFWVSRVLRYFHLDSTVWKILNDIFNKTWTVGTFEISLGGIIVFFFAIWLSYKVSKFIRFFLEEDVLTRAGVSTGLTQSISMGVHYVILGFGFMVALAAAGVELSKLTILFGALGVGIGFGMQNLVNNFVSGVILMFERPIQVGDTIQVGTLVGKVKQISIRSSTVKTFDGAEVIVPNGNLISSELINWTLTDRLRRVEVKVGVTYAADPEEVLALLVGVTEENEYVLTSPASFAIFKGFGDSALEFSLFFWTSNYDRWWTTQSEITVAVRKALKTAGIVIPFPQRDLHIKSGEIPSVRPSD